LLAFRRKEMLLAMLLILHGDSVKDRLPPRFEQVRQVVKIRLLVLGVRPGDSMDGVRDSLGCPGSTRVVVQGGGAWAADRWSKAGVVVHYIARINKPGGFYVDKVSADPLYPVLAKLLK
jgi:hypothetical protein